MHYVHSNVVNVGGAVAEEVEDLGMEVQPNCGVGSLELLGCFTQESCGSCSNLHKFRSEPCALLALTQ